MLLLPTSYSFILAKGILEKLIKNCLQAYFTHFSAFFRTCVFVFLLHINSRNALTIQYHYVNVQLLKLTTGWRHCHFPSNNANMFTGWTTYFTVIQHVTVTYILWETMVFKEHLLGKQKSPLNWVYKGMVLFQKRLLQKCHYNLFFSTFR